MDDFSLKEMWQIAKRWRKLFFLVTMAILIPAFFYAMTWSSYRSTATVEIKSPEISTHLTTPDGMDDLDQSENFPDLRISRIEKHITSTEVLTEIIHQFSLYGTTKEYTAPAALADKMRRAIQLKLIGTTVANPASTNKVSASQLSAIAFTLSFDYNDPQTTKLVVDELVSRFIDEDLKRRREQTQKTGSFLQSRLEALESSMAEQEKKIAEFQASHGDVRPENLSFNQTAASNATMSLQNLETQLTMNEGVRGSLIGQLANVEPYSRVIANGQVMATPESILKALEAEYASLIGRYGDKHPDVIKTRNQIEALHKQEGRGNKTETTAHLQSQILDVKTKLKTSLATLGEENPDVLSLKNKLAALEERLKKAPQQEAFASLIKKDADNPAYLQIAAQLNAAEAQRTALLAQREGLLKQQEKYLLAIAENPLVEQQMAALTRDLDNTKEMYRDLKEKKMATEIAEQLDRDKGSQRLVVINPPEVPTTTQPSRLKLLLGGIVFAFMSGAGAVVAAFFSSQTVSGASHMASLLGMTPLVVIPHLYTESEKTQINLRAKAMIKTSVVLGGAALVIIIFSLLPLGVMWGNLLSRLGLS